MRNLPYKYNQWTLYCREVRFKVGKKTGPVRTIYFFSIKKPRSGTPCDMPEGYKVVTNNRTGMPLLKKKC